MRNELVARILNETPVEVRVQVQMDAEQMVKEFESANMPDCRCYRKLEKCKDYMDCLQMNTKTFNMNLIQQLQQTPKWKEFEEWYNNYYLTNKHVPSLNTLEQVPYEMYKGVFEKFIESQEGVFEQTEDAYCNKTFSIWTIQQGYTKNKSFEQLLIWYFNN